MGSKVLTEWIFVFRLGSLRRNLLLLLRPDRLLGTIPLFGRGSVLLVLAMVSIARPAAAAAAACTTATATAAHMAENFRNLLKYLRDA